MFFPSEWKQGNIVPIHKKGDKQMLLNYCPVSLPICGKILERLMFKEMLEFFIENKLISFSQPGFKSGDSCINQLLSITRDIYSSFDEDLEVRSIFLVIAKAFDKVWHYGIIFKLTQNGTPGNLLNLLRDFLNERKQPVILNAQFSTWKNVSPGVPQGSILGLYCFQFTLTISQKAFQLMQNFLLMIRLCFLLYMIFKLLQIILTKI